MSKMGFVFSSMDPLVALKCLMMFRVCLDELATLVWLSVLEYNRLYPGEVPETSNIRTRVCRLPSVGF